MRQGAVNTQGGAIYSATGVLIENGSNVFEKNFVDSTNNSAANTSLGGAIYSGSAFTIKNGNNTFKENYIKRWSGKAQGGAVYANGDITLEDGTNIFDGNYIVTTGGGEETAGGAIYGVGNVKIEKGNNTFKNNNISNAFGSESFGGAVYSFMIFTIANGTNNFDNNYLDNVKKGHGGAVYSNTMVQIKDGSNTFTGNYIKSSEDGYGGAIYSNSVLQIDDGTNQFKNNYVHANTGGSYGGALYSEQHTYINEGLNTFEGNYVTTDTGTNNVKGGAIYSKDSLNISGGQNSFKGNVAGKTIYSVTGNAYGGAIYGKSVAINSMSTTKQNDFIGNQALNGKDDAMGGAIYSESTVDLGGRSRMNFTNNIASAEKLARGGAVYSVGEFKIYGGTPTFEGNYVQSASDAAHGGAVYSGTFTMTGGVSNFRNNYAKAATLDNALGGAVFVNGNASINLSNAASRATFKGNYVTDGTTIKANSLYFSVASASTFNVNGAGTLYMYDPISRSKGSSVNAGNTLSVTKNGTGTWVLGGLNDTPNTTWAINGGTFITDFDFKNNPFAITSTDSGRNVTSFSLGSGASLLVTVGGAAATIKADSISLSGSVGLNNDKIGPGRLLNGENLALRLDSSSITNNSNILSTSGTLSDSLYDGIEYTDLRWESDNSLKFNVSTASAKVNSDAAGLHAVQGAVKASVHNVTNSYIFSALSANQYSDIQTISIDPETQNSVSFLTGNSDDESEKTGKRFWGSWMHNLTRTKQKGSVAGSGLTTSGFILGIDQPVTSKTRLGLAISAAWPDYEQGSTEVDGRDIRAAIYSSSQLSNDFQLDLIASAGFGKLKSKRVRLSESMHGDYDTSNYTFGAKLTKNIKKGTNTYSPFVSYEYLHMLSDGYVETGVHSLTMPGQNNNISRVQMGMGYKHNSGKDIFSASLYYQRLFGDTDIQTTSWLTADPLSSVSLSGTGVDENSLGVYVGWKRDLSAKTSINLSYNGLYGSDSKSHTFNLGFEYKF